MKSRSDRVGNSSTGLARRRRGAAPGSPRTASLQLELPHVEDRTAAADAAAAQERAVTNPDVLQAQATDSPSGPTQSLPDELSSTALLPDQKATAVAVDSFLAYGAIRADSREVLPPR